MGTGLPALPQNLVKGIISDQYILFTDFPPAKGYNNFMPNPKEDAYIVVVHAKHLTGPRKLILDLETWLQCLSNYKGQL